MERSCPIVPEILGRDTLEFYLVCVTELLTGVSVDHLRLVQLGSRGQDLLDDLGRIFCEAEL